MSIKTGLLVLGGVAVVGTGIALAVRSKRKHQLVYVGPHQVDGGVWDILGLDGRRFDNIRFWDLAQLDAFSVGESPSGLRRSVMVLRVGVGPWLNGGADLRPVSNVTRDLVAPLSKLVEAGVCVVAMPSVLPWTTAMGNLPGAGDRVTVLRRAAQMTDEWLHSQHTQPGFEGDGLFKAIVNVDAMKAPDGMIDAQYVGVDGALNDAGQARLTALVDAAIREAA